VQAWRWHCLGLFQCWLDPSLPFSHSSHRLLSSLPAINVNTVQAWRWPCAASAPCWQTRMRARRRFWRGCGETLFWDRRGQIEGEQYCAVLYVCTTVLCVLLCCMYYCTVCTTVLYVCTMYVLYACWPSRSIFFL